MKKNIAIILNVISLLIISDAIGIGYKLMAFLFAGIIPFTNIALSSAQMLTLMSMLTCTLIFRIGIMPIVKKYNLSAPKHSKVSARRLSRV